MSLQTGVILAAIYACIALITFGYVMRNGVGQQMRRRPVQLAAAAGWPAYWLVCHSPTEVFCLLLNGVRVAVFLTAQVILDYVRMLLEYFEKIIFSEGVLTVYWVVGVMFPGYYLYSRWGSCEAGWGCGMLFLKAMAWAPFWPAYLVASLV